MRDNEIKVTLVRGGSILNSEYHNYIDIVKEQETNSKINICKSLLKIELTRFVTDILRGTELSIFDFTNKIIDDIDLSAFISMGYVKTNPLLTKIVHGNLYRVSVEASIVIRNDYSEYLNSIYNEVNSICNNIVQILNA